MDSLRVTDALRCLLLNLPKGSNLVCPRGARPKPSRLLTASLLKEAIVHEQSQATVSLWTGNRLDGLVSARCRKGRRAWEVDRVFLTPRQPNFDANNYPDQGDHSGRLPELLEGIMEAVGKRGIERMFLRVSADSSLIPLAIKAGFFPCFHEAALEDTGGSSSDVNPVPPPYFRDRSVSDDFPLYQLYNASTPQPVRCVEGLTFDQWRDGGEPSRRRREWVYPTEGRIASWVGMSLEGRGTVIEAMVDADHPEIWQDLLRSTKSQKGPKRWLVRDYQSTAGGLLLQRGLQEVSRYTTLVKTVAVPVLNRNMAPAEAKVW